MNDNRTSGSNRAAQVGVTQLQPQKKIQWLDALLLFSLALFIRTGYLLFSPQIPIVFDAARFMGAASELVAGQFSLFTQETLSVWGPGYILFLMGIFGVRPGDVETVRLVQAMLGGMTVVCIYLIALQLCNRRVAWIAALLTITYPSLVIYAGRMMAETVSIFLFWLGVLLLVLAARGSFWLYALAGLILALSSLTRPRLIPLIPLLILAVPFVTTGRWRTRLISTTIFIIPILSLLVVWNIVQREMGADPIVGSAGLGFIVSDGWTMMSPVNKGWGPDWGGGLGTTSWFWTMLREEPLYPFFSPLSLSFYHIWFADNNWHELSWLGNSLQIWQRIIVLLGLVGLGLSVTKFRKYLLLYAILLGFVLSVPLKQIEIRHNLPCMPAVFILAGLGLVTVLNWIGESANPMRLASTLLFSILGSSIVIALNQPDLLFTAVGSQSAFTLGIVTDIVIIAVSVLWGSILFAFAQRKVTGFQSLVVAGLPTGLFVLFYSAYAYVGSEPRWHAQQIDLSQPSSTVTQTIEFSAPIQAKEISQAAWLVDLETTQVPPPLDVGINDQWLAPTHSRWQTLFCNPPDRVVPAELTPLDVEKFMLIDSGYGSSLTISTRRWFDDWCDGAYGQFERFQKVSLTKRPQWWALLLYPAEIDGRDAVSLSLRGKIMENAGDAIYTKLGITFARPTNSFFYGPNPYALFPGTRTSAFRWYVTGDWRYWETTPLASQNTISRFADQTEPSVSLNLAQRLARQEGYWNIRLLVRFKNGQTRVY